MNKQGEKNKSPFLIPFDKMIHNIRFREFVYESENLDELTQAIYNIFPDAEIKSEDAEGLMEDKIIILSGVVDKKRQTKAFLIYF